MTGKYGLQVMLAAGICGAVSDCNSFYKHFLLREFAYVGLDMLGDVGFVGFDSMDHSGKRQDFKGRFKRVFWKFKDVFPILSRCRCVWIELVVCHWPYADSRGVFHRCDRVFSLHIVIGLSLLSLLSLNIGSPQIESTEVNSEANSSEKRKDAAEFCDEEGCCGVERLLGKDLEDDAGEIIWSSFSGFDCGNVTTMLMEDVAYAS
ncbi:hypothetical protein Tco_0828020 [Tanacetum coccineum]